MKIVIDLTSLSDNFSGIERFALCITKELLNRNDKNFKYVLLFKNEIHKEFINVNPEVEKIILKGKNKLVFNQFILIKELLKNKADYYFFPAFPAPFFFFSKNSISAIHDVGCWDCPTKNKRYMTLYFKLMYWKAAFGNKKIVTVSEFSKHRIMDILNKESDDIQVVYDGLSEVFSRFSYSEEEENKAMQQYNLYKNYILCLSTLEPRKNLKLLISAYCQLLKEKKIDCDLVLAGRKGWLIDDLLSGIEKEIVDRIKFTGFVEDNLLPYVYKNARVFAFPSLYEGFGVPPIEAMSMGIIVVSSNAASLPEVLGDAAIFFENNDVNSLKKAIIKAINLDDNERLRVCEKGKLQANKFLWGDEALKIRDYLFV